jgi:DNA polymerase/3'-5' exonuclease PolX
MTLQQAKKMADEIIQHLQPHCQRIAIAGSVRREVDFPKDLEILCIPNGCKATLFTKTTLFGQDEHTMLYSPYSKQFIAAVNSYNVYEGKASHRHCKINYMGNQVDLFMCSPDNWGYIYALRTGSKSHNQRLMVYLKQKGYECKDGFVYKDGLPGVIKEEGDLFTIAGMNILEPKYRK